MHKKQLALLRIISRSSGPVTGKELAGTLGVSSRTVIHYINDINAGYQKPVIISTPNGYLVDREQAAPLLHQVNGIPEGYRERSFYICKKLLLDETKGVDIFDLCDEMFISFSLLKNDLQKMNQSFAYLHVRFTTKNNTVSIIGKEKDKRKLMNHMLQQVQDTDLFDISTLKNYFSASMVEDVLEILEQAHRRSGYYLNDFAKLNILLHILTMVSRLQKDQPALADSESSVALPQDEDSVLAHAIWQALEEKYRIRIDAEDQLQLYFLVKSGSTANEPAARDTLSTYIGQERLAKIQAITREAERKFYIHLDSREFFNRFALHVNNMLIRCEQGIEISNPMKGTLRSALPFLYDIVIFMVSQLQAEELLHTALSEDEISFLVLHIGAEIEHQNETDNTVKCVLLTPDYLNISQTLSQKLMRRFDGQITLIQTVSLLESVSQIPCDLVISVFDREPGPGINCVCVTPLLTENDLSAIEHAVTRVQDKKALDYLRANFDFYFCEENFLLEKEKGLTREYAIERLCGLLIQNRYVDEEYKENVFKREKAISTAYSDFAIPHSVCAEASSNAIGVMAAPGGIQWGCRMVYVVFLMAIAPDSLNDFQSLYGVLTQILTDSSAIRSIRGCTSFESFKNTLINPKLY